MGWEGSSLSIQSVTPQKPVVATNDAYPLAPPATPPAPHAFSMKCKGVAAGTRLLFILAKSDGQLAAYEVVPCFELATAGSPDDQTATFKAYFNQRAAGTYHLAAWMKTDDNGAWEGHQQSFVLEKALEVTKAPDAAEPST